MVFEGFDDYNINSTVDLLLGEEIERVFTAVIIRPVYCFANVALV